MAPGTAERDRATLHEQRRDWLRTALPPPASRPLYRIGGHAGQRWLLAAAIARGRDRLGALARHRWLALPREGWPGY